jgi:hypothetical protein
MDVDLSDTLRFARLFGEGRREVSVLTQRYGLWRGNKPVYIYLLYVDRYVHFGDNALFSDVNSRGG